jgi:signal transduction histidine kinase
MRRGTTLTVLAAISLPIASSLGAQGHGTPAEAKAMLQKAVAHYQSVGRTQALADFTNRKAPFYDRDLYVVCIGKDRTIVAHGGFPQVVGASVDVLKDADGKPLGQAIIDAAASGGAGLVRYHMISPTSSQMQPKVSYVQKVGDDVCLVGAYGAP